MQLGTLPEVAQLQATIQTFRGHPVYFSWQIRPSHFLNKSSFWTNYYNDSQSSQFFRQGSHFACVYGN